MTEPNPPSPWPLLIDANMLAELLCRSVPALERDESAGRIPAAIRLGGSRRWILDEVRRWVSERCPRRHPTPSDGNSQTQ